MNKKKVFSGVKAWSFCLLLPMLYHAAKMQAAAEVEGYRYSYHDVVKHFFDLHWIIWLPMIVLAIVGSILVASGLKDMNN